jgi:hypothetical protein
MLQNAFALNHCDISCIDEKEMAEMLMSRSSF